MSMLADIVPLVPSDLIAKIDCPCVNATGYFDRFFNGGTCNNTDALSAALKFDIPCLPSTYGTGCCDHDDNITSECSKGAESPEYCTNQWCYVNKTICYPSKQEMAASICFDGLSYSYTTCNSNEGDFLEYASTKATINVTLTTTIPGSDFPFSYKLEENGDIAEFDGAQYRNSSKKFMGTMMTYVEKLHEISEPNNMSFNFIPRSGGSIIRSPNSKFTAAVTDVQAGISDISTGMYWITAERLALTTFTVPLFVSPLLLYEIHEPDDDTFSHAALQMFKPFHITLWILLAVFVTAV